VEIASYGMILNINTKFYLDWSGRFSNILVCFRNLRDCDVAVTDGRDL
jgi:hypothetical protein